MKRSKEKKSGFRRFVEMFSRKPKNEITTVADLLSRDDVNGILDEINKSKSDINKLIIIWEDDQGVLDWRVNSMNLTTVLGLLEMVKTYMVMDNEYCEKEDD